MINRFTDSLATSFANLVVNSPPIGIAILLGAFSILFAISLYAGRKGIAMLISDEAANILFHIPNIGIFLLAQIILMVFVTPALLIFPTSLAAAILFLQNQVFFHQCLLVSGACIPFIFFGVMLLLFFNVALAHCYMERAAGRPGSLLAGLLLATRRLPGLLALTGIILGPMLFIFSAGLLVNSLIKSKSERTTASQLLVGLGLCAAEDGLWLIASYISILMVRENLDVIPAIKRAYELRTATEDRVFKQFMYSSLFTNQIIGIPLGVWAFSFFGVLFSRVEFGQRKIGTFGYDFDLMEDRPWTKHFLSLIAMTFVLGILTAVTCFVFLQIIQTAFIAEFMARQPATRMENQ